MPKFIISGPMDIPLQQTKRVVDVVGFRELIREEHEAFDKAGCYVFSTKSSRGSTPWYVDKHLVRISMHIAGKKHTDILNAILKRIERGRLQVWTITQHGRGPRSKVSIEEIKASLTQMALRKNPELLNLDPTEGSKWVIDGLQPGRKRMPEKVKTFLTTIARRQ